MIIRIASLAVAGVLALAGVAVASHKGAKVYKTELDPVAAATAPTGKAKLVDSKKNNMVKVKVKGLTPGMTYAWHLHEGVTCATPGDIVDDFEYGELTANAAGNASARAKSNTFDWTADGYNVNVHAGPEVGGTIPPQIACGVLTRKGPQGEAKGHD